MDLTQQLPGDHHYVHSVSDQEIRIAGGVYTTALIVTARHLVTDWPVKSPDEIRAGHLEQILQLEPEVVLIGTGKRQVFLSPEVLVEFYRKGVGVEMMNTQAACRTFNVLISENRNVAAALLPPDC